MSDEEKWPQKTTHFLSDIIKCKKLRLHNIIQLSDQVGWGREYVTWGARSISYVHLLVSRFSLEFIWDSSETLSLNIIKIGTTNSGWIMLCITWVLRCLTLLWDTCSLSFFLSFLFLFFVVEVLLLLWQMNMKILDKIGQILMFPSPTIYMLVFFWNFCSKVKHIT